MVPKTLREELEPTDPSALAAHHVKMVAVNEKAFRIMHPRASSLYKACMRMHVLGFKSVQFKSEWSTVKTRLLFGLGNAIHFWIQNSPDVFADRRLGWWKCLACGNVRGFGRPPRNKCPHCNASPEAAIYWEHTLKAKGRHPVSGHPDLFIEKMKNVIRVLEIKSINGTEFKKLIAPMIDHEWQTQTYMWKCSTDKTLPIDVDPNMGYIMYVSKKHMAKELPFKMFQIKRSEPLLKRIKAKVTTFKKGIDHYPEQVPEPIHECVSKDFTNWRANTCALKKECLALLGDK
jgi:hypothetical protein